MKSKEGKRGKGREGKMQPAPKLNDMANYGEMIKMGAEI